jgi:hypothetical protein
MSLERKMLWNLLSWFIEAAEDWDGKTEGAVVDGADLQAHRDHIAEALREGEKDGVD